MTAPIKNLVFEGTGVRNAIYAGGLLALEEAGLFAGIEAVAGTSSGSIVAALVSIGFSPEEIKQAIVDLDFSRLLDGTFVGGPVRLFTSYGWHPAEYFLHELERLIAQKTGDGRITFAECEKRGYKKLRIVGTNITKRAARVFPDESSSGMAIADAVRISMSIPLFFTAKAFQGDVYVDGGVMWNYPIGIFDELGEPNVETLGFHVTNTPPPHTAHTWTPHDYFAGLFGCLIRQQETDFENRPLDRARTITVSDRGIGVTDFGIGVREKLLLVEAGQSSSKAFLEARPAVLSDIRDLLGARPAVPAASRAGAPVPLDSKYAGGDFI